MYISGTFMFTKHDTNFGNAFVDSFNNSYWKPFIHQEPHWEIEAKWWTKADLVSYNLKISGWEQQVLKLVVENNKCVWNILCSSQNVSYLLIPIKILWNKVIFSILKLSRLRLTEAKFPEQVAQAQWVGDRADL